MKLTEVYRSILAGLHITATPEGLLNYDAFDGPVPLTVKIDGKEKRLALPTREVLEAADWDSVCPFHPLSEHLNRGTSPVMNALVKIGMLRQTEVISSLIMQLTELAADSKRHAAMSPKAQKILSVLPNIDKKTVEVFSDVLRKVDMSPDRRLISIYLKRKGVYKGVTSRVCVVTFPIFDQLSDPDRKIWGVQLRKKDVEALEALLQYILPDLDSPETYSAPSDSKAAPYFESFLDAYEKVATQLNSVINVNRKELTLVEKLKAPLWENVTDDLLTHRSEIPALEGNKGVPLDDSSLTSPASAPGVQTVTTAPSRAVPMGAPVEYKPAPPAPAPMTHHQPVVVQQSNNEESLADKLARRTAAVQGAAAAPPMMYPGQQPQMGYPMPAAQPPVNYPQQMQQQPVNTGIPPGYQMVMTPQGPALVPVQPAGMPMMGAQMPMADAPAWMNNPNGTVVAGATPAPPAGTPIGGYGGGISGGAGVLFG